MIVDSIFQGNLQDDIDQLIHFSSNLHAFFFFKKISSERITVKSGCHNLKFFQSNPFMKIFLAGAFSVG